MIEREIDYYYFEETDSLDELDVVILHDENGEHEDIEYVRKDKAPGDTSDGYHTFQELYDHRTALLMAACNSIMMFCNAIGVEYGDTSQYVFKSRAHHDGERVKGYFIVGINCQSESDADDKWATWHCEDKWWDKFAIPELERAPEWDGHMPDDALERLVKALAPTIATNEVDDGSIQDLSVDGADIDV